MNTEMNGQTDRKILALYAWSSYLRVRFEPSSCQTSRVREESQSTNLTLVVYTLFSASIEV